MIAKNIKAQAFAGVVNYVMKKDAEVLKAEGVMAMSSKDITTSFELQRSIRPEIKSPVGHIPISFAPEDKERITNEFMIQLAEEYMHEMGINNTQYIIVRHHDNANPHCHIVYNRINNSGNLITDKNDYKRNIATCKKLKDRHNLTYGKNKARVKVDKLIGKERVKHEIYHAIKDEIMVCSSMNDLINRLAKRGITTEFKYKRGSNEVQGISFTKDSITFKGSQIDRAHSYRGLNMMIAIVQKEQQKTYIIKGKKLTIKQHNNLLNGKTIFVEGMQSKDGSLFDSHIKLSNDGKHIEFLRNNNLDLSPQIQQQPTQQQEQTHNEGAIISGGLGLFDLPADGGDDPEETQFRNKMQQQQRKKRGWRM